MAPLQFLSVHAVCWLGPLADVSVKAGLVLVAAAGVSLLLRRASAAWRHHVWALAVCAGLALPLLSVVLPCWHMRPVSHLLGPTVQSATPPPAADVPAMPAGTSAPVTAGPTSVPGLTAMAGVTRTGAPAPMARPSPLRRVRTTGPAAILLAWAVGAALTLLPLLVGVARTWRMARRSLSLTGGDWQELLATASSDLVVRRRVRLRVSREEWVPVVWGWLRPTILLPAGAERWTRERQWLVLLHELAHVKRGDCLVQWLAHLSCALYWFNPLAWLAAHRLRRERERACDDLVLGSGLKPSDYAGHLVELARSLRQPGLAAVAVVPMARRVGLALRVWDLLDAGRSRNRVSRRGAVVSALAVLALLAPLARVPTFAAEPAASPGHRAGPWDQWQPETMAPDPRLGQRVQIEILGRAAVPGLELLSKQTGVSLRVAPEDLETVGERKFTVIAQGCSLKAIMAQIPKALQECHWDIDPSGSEPVYLLHRNGGAESAMVQAIENDSWRTEEAARPERTARVEAARKALAMSPEELEELAKTDPLLAAAVKDPEYRDRMEMFFSLPQAKLDEFLSTGVAGMELASAPPRLQAWATKSLQEKLQKAEERLRDRPDVRYDVSGFFSALLQRSGDIGVTYDDVCLPHGFCPVELCISPGHPFDRDAMDHSDTEIIPPRTVNPVFASMYRDLLLNTGTAPGAADAVLTDLGKQYETEDIARRDQKREVEWREPRNPALQKVVVLPFTESVDPVEVLRFVAKETGLSVVSDYFDMWGPLDIPEEARTAQPIWRLLYVLSEGWSQVHDFTWFRSDEWDEAGDCLVFHDRGWYYRLLHECPESLISTYREKLKRQGHFTLEDVAAFAAEYDRRKPVHPKLRTRAAYARAPRDLRTAGLQQSDLESPLLLIHSTLSPAQREKARSAAGLAYAEMTAAQRDLVRRSTTRWDTRLVPDAEIPQAVYRVTQSGFTYKLVVEFPSRNVETTRELRPVAPEAALAGQE